LKNRKQNCSSGCVSGFSFSGGVGGGVSGEVYWEKMEGVDRMRMEGVGMRMKSVGMDGGRKS